MKRVMKWSLLLCVMVVFMCIQPAIAVLAEEQGTIESQSTVEKAAIVQQAIDEAAVYIATNKVDSEWEAIGFAQAGKEVPADYEEVFHANIQNQVIKSLESGRVKITDIERLAMAAVAINKDPQNIDGINLIENIYNSPERRGGYDTMTFQGNNGIIFALVALDTLHFDVPTDAKWTREKLVAELLKNQREDGGWSLTTSPTAPTSYDITAMALIGLAPYKDQPGVKSAIEKSVTFLSQEQGPTGGYNEPFVGGISSEATSQVIIGLTAIGTDPTSEAFTKNGISLLDHLLSYKNSDGGFRHTHDYSYSDAMATEQALQGLVAYIRFLNGEGPLYQFGSETSNPQPEENMIPLNERVSVTKGETIFIADSSDSVELPRNLPEGTTVKVGIPDEETFPYNGLDLIGSWYSFDFQFAEGTTTENFRLKLKVNEGVTLQKTGVYSFNEQNGDWEYVNGWNEAKDGYVSFEINHLSTVGIFTDTQGPTDVTVTEKETTPNSVTLGISATDPSGIKEYKIYRDGTIIASVDSSHVEFTDTRLGAEQTYEYTIIAVDRLGNESVEETINSTTEKEVNTGVNDEEEVGDSSDQNEETDEVTEDEIETPAPKDEDQSENGNKVSPTDRDKQSNEKDGNTLPKTATSTYNSLLIGIFLMIVGYFSYFAIKRKRYS